MNQFNKLQHISQLLKKYHVGTITSSELEVLNDFCTRHEEYSQLLIEFDPNSEKYVELLKEYNNLNDLDYDSLPIGKKVNSLKMYKRNVIGWAAAIILIFSLTLYVYRYFYTNESIVSTEYLIKPASEFAILKSSSGQTYHLNNKDGLKVNTAGHLFDNNHILRNISSAEQMTLIVPKGAEYSLELSDGTKIWLNSNSIIKFPVQFDKEERIVQLQGEAYFDVKHDEKRLFKVVMREQEIHVLGTVFNVKYYPEDHDVTTALYEGRVNILNKLDAGTLQLYPGDFAQLRNNKEIIKYKGDIEQSKAWRSGLFSFNNSPFIEVINEISRWYNVEVVYKTKTPTDRFTGELSRQVDFSIVLQFLRESGIEISQVGNKLIIGK